MQYLCSGMPAGAAYLPHATGLCKAFGSNRRRRKRALATTRIPRTVRDAISFFSSMLHEWDGTCPMVQSYGPTALDQCVGFVDASTEYGCGGLLFISETNTLVGFTHAWTAQESADAFVSIRPSTAALESGGITMWLEQFAAMCEAKRTHLRTDNRGVFDSFQRAFSDTVSTRTSLREARLLAGKFYLALRVSWVTITLSSKHLVLSILMCLVSSLSSPCPCYLQVNGEMYNRIADRLSHGLIDEARCLARQLFNLDMEVRVV